MDHTPFNQAFARPWPTTRRGLKLWLISIVLGLKGYGYVRGSVPPTTEYAVRVLTEGRVHIGGLHLVVPLWVIAWSLVLACAFSALTAYCHIGRDRWGYATLQAFCSLWTLLYLISLAYFHAPSDVVQGMLTWVSIALILATCAGDPPGVCTLHEDGSMLPWRGHTMRVYVVPALLLAWVVDGTWFANSALAVLLALIAIVPVLYTVRAGRRADKSAATPAAGWQLLYEAEKQESTRLRAEVARLLRRVAELEERLRPDPA